MGDVTQVLCTWKHDRKSAMEHLTPLVYAELHRIAAGYMRGARPDHTLQATALVHEAFLRLLDQDAAGWIDRSHFYKLSAQIMRAVLVDFARAHVTQKRGGALKVQITGATDASDSSGDMFLFLHDALQKLESAHPRKASVIALKYFGGLTFEEIAEAQGMSLITAKRDAAFAEAWLRRALGAA